MDNNRKSLLNRLRQRNYKRNMLARGYSPLTYWVPLSLKPEALEMLKVLSKLNGKIIS
jgi:hypothetical protein